MNRTRTWRTLWCALQSIMLLSMVLIALPSHGAAARSGWTKIELTAIGGNGIPADLLARFGAEPIADYGSYTIAYAPAGIVGALKTQAAREGVRVRGRDELDRLQLPGGEVDTREGIKGVAGARLAQSYPAGKGGLFVLQFVGPPRPEWLSELQSLGWTLSRYVPNNGYLVIGAPELAPRTRALAYVQWLDFYHPYQKAAFLPGDGATRDLLFELPAGAASETGVEAIRALAVGKIDVQRGSLDTLVYARMSEAAATSLLQHPMILSVDRKPEGQLADGRQSQSLSGLLNTAQTQPTPGADYWSWVLGHCTECASMPASNWMIGVADSGLDDGSTESGHPDLAGRKFFGILGYDLYYDPDPQCDAGRLLCDSYRHGTLVSGIAAGNASLQVHDSNGFLLGLGAAPTAGIFMTKILSSYAPINVAHLFEWTADAANHGATVQNHSWEDTANPGTYTSLSRRFDIAVRDSDDAATSARIPILLSVAAGNGSSGGGAKTSPVGMAKNVLTMGGLENYRPENDLSGCSGTKGDSFMNIMSTSRTGTNLPGYVKPDLMAPASLIVSTETSIWWPDPANPGYCLRNYQQDPHYSGDSGTSFAAPLGSAASLIVKRYLGSTPDATSPALVKATLIAGAHSVRGGDDRSHTPSTPVGAVPSQQQGFGRLTLEDILNGSQKPVFFDQSPTRLFRQAGQSNCFRLKVRDASKPVKVALVWTDAPATAGVTNPLVNDLNLEVRRASNPGSVYVGNSLAVTVPANGEESVAWPSSGSPPLDNVNNVEYFRSFMTANEQFSVTVKAMNIAGDTDGNLADFEQDYALVALNADLISVGSCDTPPTAVFTITCTGLTCSADASASVDDFGIVTYGWNWGDTLTSTTTGPITTHTYAAGGTFNVVLTTTDTVGQSTTSIPHTVVVCTVAPTISAQPTSRTINAGQPTTLSVTASAAATYQWYQGTAPSTTTPVGTNSISLTVSPSTTTSYWVRVSNGCGSVNSTTAVVTVCTPPSITTQPGSTTIFTGQSATLNVVAAGSAPLSYQWYEGTSGTTTTPVGTNSSSFTTPALSATKSYWVRVTSTCNGSITVNSATAAVTVTPPQITRRQSASNTVNSQTSITASWTQPTQGGTLLVAVISGETNPSFTWSAPAGWVQVAANEWTTITQAIYYLPNNAGGRTSETFTVSSGFHDQTLTLLEYSGAALSNPVDLTAQNGNSSNSGTIDSGLTSTTSQPKEVAVTALTTDAQTTFSNPTDGFVKVTDLNVLFHLSTAVHERIVSGTGLLGHSANVSGGGQWLGLVVTFKSANPN